MNQKIQWSDEAKARIEKVPFFVRGFAKRRVEKAAKARNCSVISLDLLLEIKNKEMPK